MLKTPFCAPSNGTIRTKDARIFRLYSKAENWLDYPVTWEGLFRLACLVKTKPMDEPVAIKIFEALSPTENGSFIGSVSEQISTARAAFAVFEYNTDKSILKRIAEWLRYLEVEFEDVSLQDNLLYQPADLMELLVQYYKATGMKSVLRLCARLRADAFDWTTALHTFQKHFSIRKKDTGNDEIHIACKPEDLEYDEKEKLINHAEMLADGMRYTAFSGMFSGHGQDLSSGYVLWEYLKKHHRAICGGTTANPFLCGSGSDQPVSNRAMAAWIEAFGAQMYLPETDWAHEELIRIVYNGMEDCLEKTDIPEYQMINTFSREYRATQNEIFLYARITRAVAAAYRYAVMTKENGIIINYLIPGRYLIMNRKQPAILHTDADGAVFQCRKPFEASVDIYVSGSETADISMIRQNGVTVNRTKKQGDNFGYYLKTENEWHNGDGFRFEQNCSIIPEDTHHQGLCFFAHNRLLSVGSERKHFAYAVCGMPEIKDGEITVMLTETEKWKTAGEYPADIPVLPADGKDKVAKVMTPYHLTECRITMFPKAGNSCMK